MLDYIFWLYLPLYYRTFYNYAKIAAVSQNFIQLCKNYLGEKKWINLKVKIWRDWKYLNLFTAVPDMVIRDQTSQVDKLIIVIIQKPKNLSNIFSNQRKIKKLKALKISRRWKKQRQESLSISFKNQNKSRWKGNNKSYSSWQII